MSNILVSLRARLFFFFGCYVLLAGASVSALPLNGLINSHDPATIVKDDDTYFHFTTGAGIWYSTSTNLQTWTGGPGPVFSSGAWPAWINGVVPGFYGDFWAPDIIQMNGYYYLYYSVSSFGSSVSAIGVARSASLKNPSWQDLGMVVQSSASTDINAIDPALFRDSDGRVYMSYGSWFGGIGVAEINPNTGKLLGGVTHLVGGNHQSIEAPYITRDGNYYYLWINRGSCCQGVNSTYYVTVLRSTSVYGPYTGERTILPVTDGKYRGPGHIGLVQQDNSCQYVSTHYYDLNDNGNAKLDILKLTYSDGWPQLTRDFSLGGSCAIASSSSSSAASFPNSSSSVSSSFSSSSVGGSIANGIYIIEAVHSGAALAVQSNSMQNGANIIQNNYTGAAGQRWSVSALDGGYYSLLNVNSGLSLDVWEMSTTVGARISQWSYWGGTGQQWTVEPLGNGRYTIRSRFSGHVLDVLNSSMSNGAGIIQWSPISGAENQQWTFRNPAASSSSSSNPSSSSSSAAQGSGGSKLLSCHGCITIDQAGSGNIEVRTRSVAGNGTTSLVVNNNTVTNWGVSTNYVSYYYGSGSFNSVQICRLNGGSDILVDYVKFNNVTYLAEEYPNDCAE